MGPIGGMTTIGQPNPRIVRNPDPANPIVTAPQDLTSGANFMKLMIEQLRAQDPLSPMQTNEFTTQLAQLNSLQQLISINSSLDSNGQNSGLSSATALLGRYVQGLDAQNNFINGKVERVEMVEGVPVLQVGDKVLLLSQVASVDDVPFDGSEPPINAVPLGGSEGG